MNDPVLREAIEEAKAELIHTAIYTPGFTAQDDKTREGARMQAISLDILLDTLGRYISNGEFEAGAIGPTH